MDEQEEIKTDKKEEPTSDAEEGDKPAASRAVEDVNLAAKRLEEATKAAREERLLSEKNYADMKLGGETGGAQEEEKKKEETPVEYKDRVMRGDI